MNKGIIKNTYRISYETIEGEIKIRYSTHETSNEALRELENNPNIKEIRDLKYIKSGIYYW